MKLFVGNLDFSTSEEVLTNLFEQFGNVDSVQLITDRDSGNSKGFGFVEMPNNSEADQAIKSLNRSNFKGRTIKVNQAQKTKNKFRKKAH